MCCEGERDVYAKGARELLETKNGAQVMKQTADSDMIYQAHNIET